MCSTMAMADEMDGGGREKNDRKIQPTRFYTRSDNKSKGNEEEEGQEKVFLALLVQTSCDRPRRNLNRSIDCTIQTDWTGLEVVCQHAIYSRRSAHTFE